MSTLAQVQDNLSFMTHFQPLTEQEQRAVAKVAGILRCQDSIPCTACRYCTAGCPMELDIPMLLRVYNDIRYSPSITSAMAIEVLPEDKKPSACVNCGSCADNCPVEAIEEG